MMVQFGSTRYDLSSRTHIMGILNVTPDSFSDGGSYSSPDDAVRQAARFQEEGADVLDIGGESSRPGADPVTVEEELRRVVPVIQRVRKELTIPISVDTMKSDVARAAVDAGATIVNDISAGVADPAMIPYVARAGVSYVAMHMKGTPRSMQEEPTYTDVTLEVTQFLIERALTARREGVTQVMIDPGLGFGKTVEHNLRLIRELPVLVGTGYPVLVGPSRKSFIGQVLRLPVEERLEGTAAAVAACIFAGAHIVRVHDVRQMKRVATMCDALKPLQTSVVAAP
jgi:dihydropteroate synthase